MKTCPRVCSGSLLALVFVVCVDCGESSSPSSSYRDASPDRTSAASDAFDLVPDRSASPDQLPVAEDTDAARPDALAAADTTDLVVPVPVEAADPQVAEAGTTDAPALPGADASADTQLDACAVDRGRDEPVLDGGLGFEVPSLTKLVPDPGAGLLYALSGNEVLVFDTTLKQQVITVDLGGSTTDLDLSPDGSLLVGAQDYANRLVVIDKSAWTVSYVATRANPQQVEIMNGGIAYYATLDQWSEVHQVDLAWGSAADIKLHLYSSFEPDLELSPSGERLFVGESGLSSSTLYELDLTVAPTQTVDQSSDFDGPARHVYLGPSGKHVYYANCQFDAADLSHPLGKVGTVFAEDAAATFAVSSRGLVDAELRTLVAPFAHEVEAAALVGADSEVWYYDPTSSQLLWASIADLLAGKTLGAGVSPLDGG